MSGAERQARYTDQGEQPDPARDVIGLALRAARGEDTVKNHRADDHTGIGLIAEEIGGRASSQVRTLKNVKTPEWPDENVLPDMAAFRNAVAKKDDVQVCRLAEQIYHFVSGYKLNLSAQPPRYFQPAGVLIKIQLDPASYGSFCTEIIIRLDNGILTLAADDLPRLYSEEAGIRAEQIDTAPNIKELRKRMKLIKG